ncbi:MAG: rhodanese-like domain-containing protein [Gammaproteobacteria bacterium]|nr:rhodanese-like domain-containing protein [Gammaproteobacteria bacterium]
MKRFQAFLDECRAAVEELFPWDLQEFMEKTSPLLLLDVREPYETDEVYIKGSLRVPRGILETACEYGYEETVPQLAAARDKDIIVICRSGNRSLLAARTMQLMGYQSVKSLRTGVRGWNDYELPLYDGDGKPVDIDTADELLASRVRPDQLRPKN